jgi:hypothetical protein
MLPPLLNLILWLFYDDNFRSLRTLLALGYNELNALSFFQSSVTVGNDSAVMHKYIFARITCNETVAF